MFTLQADQIIDSMSELGMPDNQAQALANILGKCTQELRHNGPVLLDYQWPDNAGNNWGGLRLRTRAGKPALNILQGDLRVAGNVYIGDTQVNPSGGGSSTFAFYNDTGSTITAYSVMKIAGIYLDGSTPYATLSTPTTTLQPFYAVTSSDSVAAGGTGTCVVSGMCLAKYDSATGTPAAGDEWGINGASAMLKNYGSGFQIVGIADATNKYALCIQRPMTFVKAILTGDLSATVGYANANPIRIDGSATSMVVTIYSHGMVTSGTKIASGAVVTACLMNGRWTLVSTSSCEVPA